MLYEKKILEEGVYEKIEFAKYRLNSCWYRLMGIFTILFFIQDDNIKHPHENSNWFAHEMLPSGGHVGSLLTKNNTLRMQRFKAKDN